MNGEMCSTVVPQFINNNKNTDAWIITIKKVYGGRLDLDFFSIYGFSLIC